MTASVKVFVSYSHKDKSHLDTFITCLSNMKRQNEISTWTDKDVTGGDLWKNKIDQNLQEAEIIILLISPDFMHSEYCYDIEMKKALEYHGARTARVIPVYIRPTDIKGSPISDLQGLPENRQPITQWGDKDSAWKTVVEGLRVSIAEYLKAKPMTEQIIAPIKTPSFSEAHILWLEDTEVTLAHRVVANVRLRDIFIAPDLIVSNKTLTSKIRKSINSSNLLKSSKLSLVVGEEQSGKTSLAKAISWQSFGMGMTPVYISGGEIRSANITSLIEKRSAEQYIVRPTSDKLMSESWILIIDNFHDATLNKKHLEQLLKSLKTSFHSVILFARDTFRYVLPDYEELEEFDVYQINDFGNVKRTELIEKWVSLGVEESISEKEMYKECDEISIKLNAIIRKKLLPAKPIFILSILQMLEAYTSQRLDMTSYGHCYQNLVHQALERVEVKPKEIDKYMNVLTELAWAQYANSGNALSSEELSDFYDTYASEYLAVDKVKITEDLHKANILTAQDELVAFKYPYIYYFFAAKKLADSFSKTENIKAEITKLLEGLHREDYANIIIFITHHTKERWILDEIEMCLMELFSESEPATLKSQDTAFLEEVLKDIPRLVIEERKVQKERADHQQLLDNSEDEFSANEQLYDKMDAHSLFAKINKVFKGSELIGQIIRNRHASLSKAELTDLVTVAYECGLRFLQFFIDISDLAKEGVIQTIAQQIRENPTQTDHDIIKEAKGTFLIFTYTAIYAVIKKIASSTGCLEAEEIYKAIEKLHPTPAIKLINQAIELGFHKKLDHAVLDSLANEFKGNVVCARILKEIVIQHIYMFPVDYRDKQKISACLDLPMDKLQLQDLDKKTKMLDTKR
ncbi:TIR domain-containing protein [Pseudomonas viridiflava]|uniref:TIR domain-containing protein n=1 Tax=Pseudomonas viridiflava TaxID=33069 RepID=UPI002EB3A7B0|nr:TIR domain-containing protein [Pseudomonas viridiflava]